MFIHFERFVAMASSPPGADVATQHGQLGPTVWPRLPEQRRGGGNLAERGDDDGKSREKVPVFFPSKIYSNPTTKIVSFPIKMVIIYMDNLWIIYG